MNETVQFEHRVFIRKEALKFSASHMTVFPDGRKEALHGHNYRTEITAELGDICLEKMVSFSLFKTALREVCNGWDEKVLLAARCPFFEKTKEAGGEIAFQLCGKHYLLPREDVELLPVDNISAENLAAELARRVLAYLESHSEFSNIRSIEVRVDESNGQGASCRWSCPQ